MLERLLALDRGFQGILDFTLPETLWLSEQNLRDLVVAYPTADRPALTRLARLTAEHPDEAPVVMVDSVEHLDLIEESAGSFVAPRSGWRSTSTSPGGRSAACVKIGPKRSPVRTAEQAAALAREIERRERVKLVGLMAYEGQIAGVGDARAGQAIAQPPDRAMQSASAKDVASAAPRSSPPSPR